MDQKEVRLTFDYDAELGELIWKVKKQGVVKGSIAGKKSSLGYRIIVVDHREYRSHRLIWLWHHGKIPKLIDHADQNKLNNRIENLRAASHSQNHANAPKRVQKTSSKFKGVCFDKMNKKWMAYTTINGKMKNLGRFCSEKEAAHAYNVGAIENFGEFAHLNEVT